MVDVEGYFSIGGKWKKKTLFTFLSGKEGKTRNAAKELILQIALGLARLQLLPKYYNMVLIHWHTCTSAKKFNTCISIVLVS